jgi:hypothetical protein
MSKNKEQRTQEAWDAVEISAKNFTLAKMAEERGIAEFDSSNEVDAVGCFRLRFISNIRKWIDICEQDDSMSV